MLRGDDDGGGGSDDDGEIRNHTSYGTYVVRPAYLSCLAGPYRRDVTSIRS